jgi:hypothetical protein
MGTDGAIAYQAAAPGDCAVRLRRAGKWLLVDDNDNCGGMNVTFDGIYTRSAAR